MKNFCYHDESEEEIHTTNSIAKGVFVFKRKKNNDNGPLTKKTKRKTARKTNETSSDLVNSAFNFFGLEKKGLESFRHDRYQMYHKLNRTLSKIMSENQKEIFGKVLSDVVKFAKDASERHMQSTVTQIPTCVLLTGVNLPDHDDMFCILRENLLSEVSPHVATIKSTNCPSLKMLVVETVRQFMRMEKISAEQDGSNSEDEEDEVPEKKSQKLVGSFPRLKVWYENMYKNGIFSPNKKTLGRANFSRPPLIIVLEDFEAFSSQVLQNFIQNTSMFCGLPFIFIFGVATTIDAVHKALPHALTSLLTMQKFTAEPSIEVLDRFIKAVVTSSEVTFKVGSKILQLLFETFAFCDLSVKNVLTGYQWCLLEHFSGRPISILCVDDPGRRNKIIMKELSDKDLDSFMMLSSFRKLVSSNPNNYVSLLSDKVKFREFLAEKIETLWERTETFNIFVGALHAMAVDLPKDTLGQCFYSVYCSSMSEPVTMSHEYRKTFLYLQHSERSELCKRINALIEHLKVHSVASHTVRDVITEATVHLESLKQLEIQVESKDSPTKETSASPRSSPRKQPPSTPTCSSPSSAVSTPGKESKAKEKFNRFLFQEKLLQEARQKSREECKKNPYVELRSKVLNFCHRTFEKYLGNESTSCLPSKQVFFEVKYFDDVSLIRESLVGNPRDSLQTALQDPFVYIQHKDLELASSSDIPGCLPDVCIAYKLHLECGRYINLYDWYQCWLSIVTSNPDGESTPASSKTSKKTTDQGDRQKDEKLQARFSRAVSELQFLGYIKPSKRKTDHVERLALNC